MTPTGLFLCGFGLGVLVTCLAVLLLAAQGGLPRRPQPESPENIRRLYDREGRYTQ